MSISTPADGRGDAGVSSPPPIAYLLKRYPRLSETFILHEMLALQERGVPLVVYSMMDPGEKSIHPDVARLAAKVTYLPTISWENLATLAHAHARLLRRVPRQYLQALGRALSRHDPLAGLRHFLRGGWLGLELDRQGISHLHAHFAHGPAATAQFVSLLTGLPFSFTAHAKDIYTTPRERVAERIREARFVVTCTGHNYTYLAHLVDSTTARRIHRIYHGVDLRRFRLRDAAPDIVRHPPLILAVGRLVEKKGHTYLLEACTLLRASGVSFRCQFVGDGPLQARLRDQIAAAGLNECVELLGTRTQEELVGIYREATIVALPCVILDNGDRDGIPNVLVEAMSMGIPVVATRVSGIPELIDDGRDGLLVPPRDARALAKALAAVLDDDSLRERISAAAHRTVTERFDLAHNAALLDELFAHAQASDPGQPIESAYPSGEPERVQA